MRDSGLNEIVLKEVDLKLENMITNPKTYKRESKTHPRVHAKKLDKILGYKIPKIELKLLQRYRAYFQENDESNRKQHFEGTQTWIGLHPQVLQTPYNDIYDALTCLLNFNVERVVDIGAGYGRVGLVMNCLFPLASFTGYEILKKRESEGNRIYKNFNLDNCKIINQDVLDDKFQLPKAEVYFIYDFSEAYDICKILDQLSSRIKKYTFFLITKGDRIDYLLSKKYKEFKLTSGFLNSGELKIFSSIIDTTSLKQQRECNG